MSEDGRKQQAKLKELAHIAEKLSCTLPQLAIGKGQYEQTLNFSFLLKRTKKQNNKATLSNLIFSLCVF